MLGIKRLKDIKKGLYQANTNSSSQSSTAVPSPNNHRLPSTPSRQSTGSNNRPSVPIRQTKSTLERCNSLENNSIIPTQLAIRKPSIQLSHLSPTRITSNGDSSNYATLRKPPISPKILLHKQQQQQKIISNVSPMATSSFRLPPPLSSTTTNNTNSPLNNELLSSSRTRSLENINSNEKKLPSISLQNDTNSSVTNGNSSQSMQTTNKKTNLQLLGDANLSSSTESTNGIPFANENVGTIKQRSPHNQNNNLYNTSLDTMKRSLPIQFFEQSNTHLLRPSYPMTTAIYDNNDRFISTNIHSPNKQIRKTSTLSPTQINGRNSSIVTGDKRLQYIEIIKKDKQNKTVKNDTTNALSDIDSMLSDLNRELDQMLDYEPMSSTTRP
ncbi:unnamed protein product [Rotaria sp. Silwood2]|nr:unnamed protein product [Rotaria sp. Silwood2]